MQPIFEIWASPKHERWTRYAKPSLFLHSPEFEDVMRFFTPANLPPTIREYSNKTTAFILDMPGEETVATAVALARQGFAPVPLFNGIHETKIGALTPVVDNTPTIRALNSAASTLRSAIIPGDAPPVFMLDYNRYVNIIPTATTFDNRWEIEPEDMPEAAYLSGAGIATVVLWTTGPISQDVQPIIHAYRQYGIQVDVFPSTYNKEVTPAIAPMPAPTAPQPQPNLISTTVLDNVRKVENARTSLMLVGLIALVNFIFMFFIREEPLLWIAPSVMWLTYLWVPEIMGDMIAIAMVVAYIFLYIASGKQRHWVGLAAWVFIADTVIFYLYALSYGLWDFTGHSVEYGALVFIPPALLAFSMAKGAISYSKLHDITEVEYAQALRLMDANAGINMGTRRYFRGYRGYGGSGRGGYGGYGGGRYGGGFGG